MNCSSIRYGATGTVQTYEVPATGTYSIEAAGVQQGTARSRSKGLFHLVQGDILKIVVGCGLRTGAPKLPIVAGHGGCSFVWKCATNLSRSDSVMLVATSSDITYPAGSAQTGSFKLPNDDGYVLIGAVVASPPPMAETGRPSGSEAAGLAYAPPGTRACALSSGGTRSFA